MKISIEILKERNPCEDGLQYYIDNNLDQIDWSEVTELNDVNYYGSWFINAFRLSNIKLIDSTGNWIKEKFDKNGNQVYYEDSGGYWEKQEFDERGNCVYTENSEGYWTKQEFDECDNCVYIENSDDNKQNINVQ